MTNAASRPVAPVLSARDRAKLATAYELISAAGVAGLTTRALFEAGVRTAGYCLEQLLERGMVVRRPNPRGQVDSVYLTVRNAR